MGAVESRDYYGLLGVDPDASADEIKTAYKSLARVFHPDSNFFSEIIDDKPSPEQIAKFKEITAAYNTLIDRDARKDYDSRVVPEVVKKSGWDSDNGDWLKSKTEQAGTSHPSGSHAWGVFGSVKTERRSAFDSELNAEVRPVSEAIRVHRSFWGRLLAKFRGF